MCVCPAGDHPCHDIAKGERFLKDIYEALRAGPKWESTMFFIAYDDGGGGLIGEFHLGNRTKPE
eukprot:COSAG02_NODE_11214_length_1769_cov_3.247904_3_plen_63_part_01